MTKRELIDRLNASPVLDNETVDASYVLKRLEELENQPPTLTEAQKVQLGHARFNFIYPVLSQAGFGFDVKCTGISPPILIVKRKGREVGRLTIGAWEGSLDNYIPDTYKILLRIYALMYHVEKW